MGDHAAKLRACIFACSHEKKVLCMKVHRLARPNCELILTHRCDRPDRSNWASDVVKGNPEHGKYERRAREMRNKVAIVRRGGEWSAARFINRF